MGIVGLFRAIRGVCETRPLGSDMWSLEGNKARVRLSAMPQPLPKGGAVYLEGKGLEQPVLIVRTEDDRYLAFSNRCTHGGRKLDPVPGEPVLRCCSIGHSTFDLEGSLLSGPAKEPLHRYEVAAGDGDIVISL